MKDNRYLRAAAREQLGGNIFSAPWLLALLASLLYSLISGFTSSFFIGIFLIGPLSVGLHAVFLPMTRDAREYRIEDLFYSFESSRFVKHMVLGLLYTLYLVLWSLLLVVPAIVKSYSYRLAFYLAIDHPELTANECITMSRRLMDGRKMQAFLLDLSFIGWMLLGTLACGIGTLFVAPYQYAASANFYKAICEANEELLKEASAEKA